MYPLFNSGDKLNLLQDTVYFFKKHFWTVTMLGFVAALGRVIQLGGFGEIASWANICLEIIIESARLLLCLYVLGLANIKKGASRMIRFFTGDGNRKTLWLMAMRKLRQQWMTVLLSTIGFLIIAWGLNYLIDLLAYQTCLYLTLKREGILAAPSSEWTILLFFKNLSVIPLMLIFDMVLVLWATNKLHGFSKPAIE